MSVYQVGADGKAPKGAKSGDQVVTAGGTYQITGVNADGTYKSTKVSDVTTSTYTGNYDTAPSSSSGSSYAPGSSNVSSGGSSSKSTGGTTNYYQVGADGKAPAGLKKNDQVVTNGGTYQITGVNADGTYKSTKVSDVTPATFTGTYATAPGSGAPNFEDYVDNETVDISGYLQAWYDAMQQKNENTAKQLQAQIAAMRERANSEYDDAERGAYISNQLALRDTAKAMANAGLGTQGYTETTLANQGRDYQNAMNEILKQRQNTMQDYDLQETQATTDYYNALNEIYAQMALEQMQAARYDNETAYDRGMNAYTAAYNKYRDDQEQDNFDKEFAWKKDVDTRDYNRGVYEFDTTRDDSNYWKGVDQQNIENDRYDSNYWKGVDQKNTERQLDQNDRSLDIQAAKANSSGNGYDPQGPDQNPTVTLDSLIATLFPEGTEHLTTRDMINEIETRLPAICALAGLTAEETTTVKENIMNQLGIEDKDVLGFAAWEYGAIPFLTK